MQVRTIKRHGVEYVKITDVELCLFRLARGVSDPMAKIALESAAEAFAEMREE